MVLATTTTKGSVLSGVCLRAKPGRPKVKGNDEKTKVVGRPCSMPLKVDILCPSCGQSNDLREASNCTTCNQSLVSKGGKPEVKPTTQCPCGQIVTT